MRMATRRIAQALALSTILIVPGPSWARQDAPPDRWQDTAEFSYVLTAGNSETSTLGFKNKLWRIWTSSALEFNAGGVRAKSTTRLFAVGTASDFDIVEESELTAENYYLNGRYDRKITDRFFWFAGAGWDKNTFAGIDNRYAVMAGLGNIWVDREEVKFRTDYALTFTKQDDVVEDPTFDDTFLGARLSWSFMRKLGASTVYTNDLILDENLDDTSDFRANMINSIAVAMSERLALKVSLQWLYDHQPAIGTYPLFDTAGMNIGTVSEELDTLDTILTTSLVVNF